jgi:parallel beta-helix repeat protein
MAYTTAQKRNWLNNISAGSKKALLGDNLLNSVNDNYVGLDYPGRVYFVDNVSGSATNDGLSWGTAFAQISTAVTAWEAYRLTLANVYTRGKIYVMGTGVAYTAVTALPSYVDIIGVSSLSYGNGAGIAMVGVSGADAISGTARGLNMYNLQFISGGAFWCADFVSLFRSEIAFCTFQNATAHADGGIRFSGSSGGLYIHDCQWTGSNDMSHKIGISVSGPNFDSCRIENNQIRASDKGIYIAATCTISDNTVWKSNVIHGGRPGLTLGIHDAAVSGMQIYAGNYISATTPDTIVNLGSSRFVGNYSQNGFAAAA